MPELEEVENNPFKKFKKEDICDIANPAYVVEEEISENCKSKGCGYVVAWNEEFERLTNFTPSDIDGIPCHTLFDAIVWKDKVNVDLSKLIPFPFDFESFKNEIDSQFQNKIKCNLDYKKNVKKIKKELGDYLRDKSFKNAEINTILEKMDEIDSQFINKIEHCNLVFEAVVEPGMKNKLENYLRGKSFEDNTIETIFKKSECTKRWLQICSEKCEIRNKKPSEAGAIEKLWINSKDLRGGDIKKCVDVFIFPFEEEEEGMKKKSTLHILFSREEAHTITHFQKRIQDLKSDVKKEDIDDNIAFTYKQIHEDDVFKILNPTYVVKAKSQERGCVVAWNEEFERLTNFTPYDIDNNSCDVLFEGGILTSDKKWKLKCNEWCEIRNKFETKPNESPTVIKEFWINSKDQRGSDIKRRVDIFIFPFKREDNIFTLHILLDTEIAHDRGYFDQNICKT